MKWQLTKTKKIRADNNNNDSSIKYLLYRENVVGQFFFFLTDDHKMPFRPKPLKSPLNCQNVSDVICLQHWYLANAITLPFSKSYASRYFFSII